MTPEIQAVATGYTTALAIVLKKKSSPTAESETFVIAADANVQAVLVSGDHSTALTAPFSLRPDAPGADWANSLVVVEIPGTATSEITYQGLAKVEIQVEESGYQTPWFDTVRIVTGHL